MHYFNEPSIFDYVFAVVKQFMKEKTVSRVRQLSLTAVSRSILKKRLSILPQFLLWWRIYMNSNQIFYCLIIWFFFFYNFWLINRIHRALQCDQNTLIWELLLKNVSKNSVLIARWQVYLSRQKICLSDRIFQFKFRLDYPVF